METPNKTFSMAEVARHNKEGDAWVVIFGKVYDLSRFARLHPGGKAVITAHAGKDCTELYKTYHNESILPKYHKKLCIGSLEGYKPRVRPTPPGCFGDMVPYGDPAWYQGWNSPYYKETHLKWRKHCREFVEREIVPRAWEIKDMKVPPRDLLLKMGKAGLLAAMLGPPWCGPYLDDDTHTPEDFDWFHWQIAHDEVARVGMSAVIAALTNGPSIACAGIRHFGSEDVRRRYLPDILMGRKMIALAVSEAQAGSDVAGLTCAARRDGDDWVINGAKKWITNGAYADYYATLVKSGDARGQLTFFVVERGMEGFASRKIAIRDSDLSGTAYLTFDNVRVPNRNMIGKEGAGFKICMYSFNAERLYVAIDALRLSRVCLEESVKYTMIRRAFGKPLAEQQSIRMKLAGMASRISMFQAWIEQVLFQMCTMSHAEANMKTGDVVALIKAEGSRVYEYCAREATMCFGGQALYMTGVGRKIEPAVATVKAYQIPAGAEDVMLDFAGRTMIRKAKALAKL